MPSLDTLSLTVQAQDGTTATVEVDVAAYGYALVRGPLTYRGDGMTTGHSIAWMREPKFIEAYQRGMATGHRFGENLHIEWRVATACWAASVASKLEGDFVECGVNTGIFAAAICSYLDFAKYQNRRFFLVDTYAGIPDDQLTEKERESHLAQRGNDYYFDSYELVCKTFAEYPNVVPVRGRVPEILPHVPSSKVAYLCLDMNSVVPEIAAIEYFWHKIVAGGMILLDDYGFGEHEEQRIALDAFAADHDVHILTLPTGHGLLIKPPMQ